MEDMNNLPLLFVRPIENAAFERFLVVDENERVWTGNRFESDGGLLFADRNDASLAIQRLLKSHFEDVEPKRFKVPVIVEVLSREPISMDDVATYLSTATQLLLDVGSKGYGPKGSLVIPRIAWHRIESIEENAHE